MTEAMNAIFTTKEHPDYVAALARRGITDLDAVQIDPWPAGAFGYDAEAGPAHLPLHLVPPARRDRQRLRAADRRADRPLRHGRQRGHRGDRPRRGPAAAEPRELLRRGPAEPARADSKPISITQPEGPSFTVDGNLVQWQKWRFRVAFDPYEGLVLHQVAYDDDGRVRSVLHRASISEMVVPYGDPSERHGWKNAFDAGEWGLGRMTQPLTLGCDCVGEIHYFDATLANEQGAPWVIENAICMHEEDYGILWKHVDLYGGRSEVRRSRRLVVSFVATVGNYEYGFFWYFYLDGNIQLEVKLTGHRVADGDRAGHDTRVRERHRRGRRRAAPPAPVQRAPRLRRRRSGERGPRGRGRTSAARSGQPVGQRVPAEGDASRSRIATRCARSTRRLRARGGSRIPTCATRSGNPSPTSSCPTMSTPTLLAAPDSSVGRRAGFAQHNLWVTPYARDERRAAGEYPNQHAGGDGLPAGRPPTARSPAPTSCAGTRSASRTSCAPRTGRSCRSSTPASCSRPTGFFDRNPDPRSCGRPSTATTCNRRWSRADGEWTREELQRAHDNFIATAQESGRTGDWGPWAELFTEDAEYVEHHYGTFQGRAAIQAWITETMAQWPNSEMTEFPHDWCVCDVERGWWICQIENRFRDPGDGKVYEAYEPHRVEVRRATCSSRPKRTSTTRRRSRPSSRSGSPRHAPTAATRLSSRSTRRGSRPRAWRGTSRRRRPAGSGPSRAGGARGRVRRSRS